MPDLVTLGPWLRRFLGEHIVTERNLARNTRKSYRDTFSLLLPFVSRKLRKPVDRLAVATSPPGICCCSSRILKKIAAAPSGPAISGWRPSGPLPASSAAGIRPMSNGAVTSAPSHRRSPCRSRSDGSPGRKWRPCSRCPTERRTRGQSEYALLLFLYNTGARVSEAIQLKVSDLHIGHRDGHDLATLHGKGGKTRQCPLWPETERVLTDVISGRASG